MSLRIKVIGALALLLGMYGLTAWGVLSVIQSRSFTELEHRAAAAQLARSQRYLELELKRLELLAIDWGSWDDTWEAAMDPRKFDNYYSENLSGGYLSYVDIGFGIILDRDERIIWGEVYNPGSYTGAPISTLFSPEFPIPKNLISPNTVTNRVLGFVNTAHGPAIAVSTSILRSNDSGPVAGHLVFGKLLSTRELDKMGSSLIAPISLLPTEHSSLSEDYRVVLDTLLESDEQTPMISEDQHTYAMSLIRDVNQAPLSILRVGTPTEITTLGAQVVSLSMAILFIAAVLVTLCLWFMLKGLMISPIEKLTAILRSFQTTPEGVRSTDHLSGTVRALGSWRDGMSKSSRQDEIGKLVKAFQCLSLSLSEATSRIWRIAHIDGLTDLANRRLFIQRLSEELDFAKENHRQVAVLFVDLDGFKQVNDEFGHRAGDEVLIGVASRLTKLISLEELARETALGQSRDLPGRIGGDEFVVMLSGVNIETKADAIAQEIVQLMAEPFPLLHGECTIGASVGFAVYPTDGKTLDDVLQRADSAMYRAKRDGKGTWHRAEKATPMTLVDEQRGKRVRAAGRYK
ncbi:MAG: diguanylate cyclase [Pseudomonadota bacterium]